MGRSCLKAGATVKATVGRSVMLMLNVRDLITQPSAKVTHADYINRILPELETVAEIIDSIAQNLVHFSLYTVCLPL